MGVENILEIILMQQKLDAQKKRDAQDFARQRYLNKSNESFRQDMLLTQDRIERERSGLTLLSEELKYLRERKDKLTDVVTATGFNPIEQTEEVSDVVDDLTGSLDDQVGYLNSRIVDTQSTIDSLLNDQSDMASVLNRRTMVSQEFPEIVSMGGSPYQLDTQEEVTALQAQFGGDMPDRYNIYSEDYKLSEAEKHAMGMPMFNLETEFKLRTIEEELNTEVLLQKNYKTNIERTVQQTGIDRINLEMQLDTETIERNVDLHKQITKEQETILLGAIPLLSIQMNPLKTGGTKDEKGNIVGGLSSIAVADYFKSKGEMETIRQSYMNSGLVNWKEDLKEDELYTDAHLKVELFESGVKSVFKHSEMEALYGVNRGKEFLIALNEMTGESPNWQPIKKLMKEFIYSYDSKRKAAGEDFDPERTLLGSAGLLFSVGFTGGEIGVEPRIEAMQNLRKSFKQESEVNKRLRNLRNKTYEPTSENPLGVNPDISAAFDALNITENDIASVSHLPSDNEDIYDLAQVGYSDVNLPTENVDDTYGGFTEQSRKKMKKIADQNAKLDSVWNATQANVFNKITNPAGDISDVTEDDFSFFEKLGITAGAAVPPALLYKFTTGQIDEALTEMVKDAGKNWLDKGKYKDVLSSKEFKKKFGKSKNLLSKMKPQELRDWLRTKKGSTLWNETTIKKFFKSIGKKPSGLIKLLTKGGNVGAWGGEMIGEKIDDWTLGPDGMPVFQTVGGGAAVYASGKYLKKQLYKNESFLSFVKKRFPGQKASVMKAQKVLAKLPNLPTKWGKRAKYIAKIAFSFGVGAGVIWDLYDEWSGYMKKNKSVEEALENIEKETP